MSVSTGISFEQEKRKVMTIFTSTHLRMMLALDWDSNAPKLRRGLKDLLKRKVRCQQQWHH